MTSSGTSTDRGRPGRDIGIQPWHFYLLLAMGGATWAVMVSRNTQHGCAAALERGVPRRRAGRPRAASRARRLLLQADADVERAPLIDAARARELERDKALVLRSIKELEFDRAMGKVGDADFAEIGGHLRARALDADAGAGPPAGAARRGAAAKPVAAGVRAGRGRGDGLGGDRAPSCGTSNDVDAHFCKRCGARLDVISVDSAGRRDRTPPVLAHRRIAVCPSSLRWPRRRCPTRARCPASRLPADGPAG